MKKKKTNEYVVIIVLDFLLAGFYLMHRHDALIYALLALSFFAILIPALRQLVARGFDLVTGFIGTLITNLVLSLVFFLMLTPITLIRKIAGKQHRNFKLKDSADSFFTVVQQSNPQDEFEKIW